MEKCKEGKEVKLVQGWNILPSSPSVFVIEDERGMNRLVVDQEEEEEGIQCLE